MIGGGGREAQSPGASPQDRPHGADHGTLGSVSIHVMELRRIRGLGVQGGQRIGNTVLREVIACGHFPAETVAPIADGHLRGCIGRSLHQDRHSEIGQAQRFGNSALIAKVRQRYNDPADFVAMFLEKICAASRFLARFHCAVLGIALP